MNEIKALTFDVFGTVVDPALPVLKAMPSPTAAAPTTPEPAPAAATPVVPAATPDPVVAPAPKNGASQ